MSTKDWGFVFSEPFEDMLKAMRELSASVTAINQVWQGIDFSGMTTALKQCADAARVFPEMMFSLKSVLGWEDVINTMHAIKMTSIAESIRPLLDAPTYDLIETARAMQNALKGFDWSWVREACSEAVENYEEQNFSESVVQETLTPESRAEIAADVTDVLCDPENAHQVSQSKYAKWKEKHPLLADLFLILLFPFLVNLLSSLLSPALTALVTKNAQVYEEPISTSCVVYNVTVENNITVIGDAPYYYEVEFTDPETGELQTGYIYKGNVTVEQPEETVAQEEAEMITVPTTDASLDQLTSTE